MIDSRAVVMILGGGRGSRLHPLTLERAKPAVAVAGKYRLVDLTISNCINSGLTQIFVLTQFLFTSLHRHIMQTYRFDAFGGGFVEILAAEQKQVRRDWFQGTADAVRQSLDHALRRRPDAVLILSGDHIYRMDYWRMLGRHLESGADVTVAVHPVDPDHAHRFGLVRLRERRVVEVVEKPGDRSEAERFLAGPEILAATGRTRPGCLASMGIYVFRPAALRELLADGTCVDFGGDILPRAAAAGVVVAHPFAGYWRDIGTIRAFFDAHMDMLRPASGLRLHAADWPIYTHARHLPPARVVDSVVGDCLLAEGAEVHGAELRESVLGVRTVVRHGARLRRVIVLGADGYDGEDGGPSGLGIGEGAVVEQAIIDKDASVGAGVVVTPKPPGTDAVGDGYWVRDGITVIPKGATIPAGTRI